MTDKWIRLNELQKIRKAITKTKEEDTLNFKMLKLTERLNFQRAHDYYIKYEVKKII